MSPVRPVSSRDIEPAHLPFAVVPSVAAAPKKNPRGYFFLRVEQNRHLSLESSPTMIRLIPSVRDRTDRRMRVGALQIVVVRVSLPLGDPPLTSEGIRPPQGWFCGQSFLCLSLPARWTVEYR